MKQKADNSDQIQNRKYSFPVNFGQLSSIYLNNYYRFYFHTIIIMPITIIVLNCFFSPLCYVLTHQCQQVFTYSYDTSINVRKSIEQYRNVYFSQTTKTSQRIRAETQNREQQVYKARNLSLQRKKHDDRMRDRGNSLGKVYSFTACFYSLIMRFYTINRTVAYRDVFSSFTLFLIMSIRISFSQT